jgi:hypothetical protein
MSESVFQGEAVAGALVLLAGLWMSLGRRESVNRGRALTEDA